MSTVKLQGKDGKEPFDVSFKAACCSRTLKTMMTDLGSTEDDENGILPITNVNDAILRKAMEWAEHHKDDPEQAEDDKNKQVPSEDISAWDAKYLEVDQDTLFDLMLAGYYLGIEGLVDLTTKTAANLIKGKNPDEIRRQFNIPNNFTPEEEEQVRMENELVRIEVKQKK